MSIKFEVSRRRLMYIRLANKEVMKNCVNKTGSINIVRACDRLTIAYTHAKPIISVKADGTMDIKDVVSETHDDVA